jgi:hypothetical protein
VELATEEYISEVLHYQISKVALRPDGILHLSIKSDELFFVKDYHDLMDAAFKIGNGKKFLNLITVGKHTTPDHHSRVLSTSKEGSVYKRADAFVICSLSQKLIANFYMNFHKPFAPTRFFTEVEEAVKWLGRQK